MKTDYTGIAYLAALALGAVAVYYVWKQASGAASAVSNAVSSAASSAANAIGTVAQAVDPTNAGNVFASTTNKFTQIATGDALTTFGSSLYDATVSLGMNTNAGAIAIAPSTPVGANNSDRKSLGATGTW